jgi:hypothetical protein
VRRGAAAPAVETSTPGWPAAAPAQAGSERSASQTYPIVHFGQGWLNVSAAVVQIVSRLLLHTRSLLGRPGRLAAHIDSIRPLRGVSVSAPAQVSPQRRLGENIATFHPACSTAGSWLLCHDCGLWQFYPVRRSAADCSHLLRVEPLVPWSAFPRIAGPTPFFRFIHQLPVARIFRHCAPAPRADGLSEAVPRHRNGLRLVQGGGSRCPSAPLIRMP